MTSKQLKKFEEILLKRKTQVEKNIKRLTGELDAIFSEDLISDMEDLATLSADNAAHNFNLAQQEHELAEIKHALDKIKNGTYGICEKSGEAIDIARLEANPLARYTQKIQEEIEKSS